MTCAELLRTLAFTAPLVSAMMCIVVTLVNTWHCTEIDLRKARYRMMTAYLTIILFWFGMVGYSLSWDFLSWLSSFLNPLYLIMYVLVYGLVRTVTGENKDKPLPRAHYIVPLCVAMMEFVFLTAVPPAQRIRPGYGEPFEAVGYIMVCLAVAYSIVYPVLCIGSLARYLRSGSVRQRELVTLLLWSAITRLVILPVPVIGMLLGVAPFANLGVGWFVVVAPSFISYPVSYLLLLSQESSAKDETRSSKKGESEQENELIKKTARLTRDKVDGYLEDSRPWLDPRFSVQDMARDLLTNRTYMSAFINTEYGMNFNSLINNYRLVEIDRLQEDAPGDREEATVADLVKQAGFGNYRSYHRAKTQEQ